MKWINAKNQLPENSQEVLIRCEGSYNLAVFDETEKAFKLRGGRVYHMHEHDVQWTRLIPP